jgi:signal peptidase II
MRAVPANRWIVFLLIAVVGCAVDLLTKSWLFSWLGMPGEKPSYWLVDGILGFTISLNEGALFGLGQGQVNLFAVLSVVAAIGVLYWLFWKGAAEDWLLTIALGAVMAGIFGNLYDRLGLPGLKWAPPDLRSHQPGDPVYAVRDWIHFKIDALGFDWPIFNIADSLLVCGAGLLIWHSFRSEAPQTKPNSEGASKNAAPSERQGGK